MGDDNHWEPWNMRDLALICGWSRDFFAKLSHPKHFFANVKDLNHAIFLVVIWSIYSVAGATTPNLRDAPELMRCGDNDLDMNPVSSWLAVASFIDVFRAKKTSIVIRDFPCFPIFLHIFFDFFTADFPGCYMLPQESSLLVLHWKPVFFNGFLPGVAAGKGLWMSSMKSSSSVSRLGQFLMEMKEEKASPFSLPCLIAAGYL